MGEDQANLLLDLFKAHKKMPGMPIGKAFLNALYSVNLSKTLEVIGSVLDPTTNPHKLPTLFATLKLHNREEFMKIYNTYTNKESEEAMYERNTLKYRNSIQNGQ